MVRLASVFPAGGPWQRKTTFLPITKRESPALDAHPNLPPPDGKDCAKDKNR